MARRIPFASPMVDEKLGTGHKSEPLLSRYRLHLIDHAYIVLIMVTGRDFDN